MRLLERDQELAALADALARAGSGHGSIVLVHGEAGIGKSSLVRQAFPPAGDGPRVLWGSCEALFTPRPLGPLHDVAARMDRSVGLALRGQAERGELFRRVLDDLAASRPATVLVIEDLHWADAATLDLVKFLARRIAAVPALLVVTFRDDELDERHQLRTVLGDLPADSVVRLKLAPLSRDAVRELMHGAGVWQDDLFARTQGNPFFVSECLRAEGLPATVSDAVRARLARLPPGVAAVVELASLVPGRVEAELVDALLPASRADVEAALSSGLLLPQAHHYVFRHELARIAVEASIPPHRAAGLHQRILAYLEAAGAAVPGARLVHHAAGAGDRASVLRLAPRAAEDAAARGAHRQAAALYRTALAEAQLLQPAQRAALLDKLAEQCGQVEDFSGGIQARQAAVALWEQLGDTRRQGDSMWRLARLQWAAAGESMAVDAADRAIALLRAQGGRELAWAVSNRAQLHMLANDMDSAMRLAQQVVDMCPELGDDELLSHALNNLGAARYSLGLADGWSLMERSLATALHAGTLEHIARAYINLVYYAALERRYALARSYVGQARAYFSARDADTWLNTITALNCNMDLEQCRWDGLDGAIDELLRRAGRHRFCLVYGFTVRARLRLRANDMDGARQALAEATAIASASTELLRLGPLAIAHAEAAWMGLPEADTALVRRVRDLAIAKGNGRFAGDLAFWLHALGEHQAPRAGSLHPAADESLRGHWRAAAALWAEAECRVEQALALLCSGDEPAMREALLAFESLQAPGLANRCRQLLRQRGLKGLARGPRETTARHPAGLTQREVEVLELLVLGLTNRQIAAQLVRSEKTVNHHISAILGKLGARSRTEASAIAVARGLVSAR